MGTTVCFPGLLESILHMVGTQQIAATILSLVLFILDGFCLCAPLTGEHRTSDLWLCIASGTLDEESSLNRILMRSGHSFHGREAAEYIP